MTWTRLSESRLGWFGFALLSCAVALSGDVSGALVDHFHEGEFLGFFWHMGDYYRGLARFPLLVHGAMDYVPSFVAVELFGYDRAIVGTRMVLLLLSALQYLLFLDVGYSLTRKGPDRLVWTAAFAAYFWYATPPLNSSVVVASYFPVRDLFLTFALWCTVKYALESSPVRANVFLAAGSAGLVASFFWCYNRGLIAIIYSFIFFVGLIINRRILSSFIAFMSVLFFAFIANSTMPFGTIQENLHNIIYWMSTSSEINYIRLEMRYITGITGLLVLCLFSASVCFLCLLVAPRMRQENAMLTVVAAGLVIVQAFCVYVVFGVPILEYSQHAGWPSLLLLLLCGSRLREIETSLPPLTVKSLPGRHAGSDRTVQLALAAAALSFAVFGLFCQKNLSVPYLRFAKNLVAPVANDAVLPKDLTDVSDRLRGATDKRYFNWVNDGVVAFLARKPLFSDYPYVYYAGKSQERALLEQLEASHLSLIVTGADLWPANRHDERMGERFPLVETYIRRHYPRTVTMGRYTVALAR